MNEKKYPHIEENSFTCRHCGHFSKQIPYELIIENDHQETFDLIGKAKRCGACGKLHIWVYDELTFDAFYAHNKNYSKELLIYPHQYPVEQLNEDYPEEVQKLIVEAAKISSLSPRGAAALLRLAMEILIKDVLKNPDIKINEGIAELVKKGLDPSVQKALDIVRITGNEAVHPGTISTDDPETVSHLFDIINNFVNRWVTSEKHLNSKYNTLPEGKLRHIEERDNPSKKNIENDT